MGIKNLLRSLYPYITPKWRHDLFWINYARLRNKGLIHFIGNSHARVFSLQPGMIAHVISASTAHNLVKENSTTQSRDKLFKSLKWANRKRDIVVLVFGEVDCRYHIYYQYMKNDKRVSMEGLIDATIGNYSQVIEEIRDKGYEVWVCSVVPASFRESTDYPYYGSPETRTWITQMFNSRLYAFCSRRGVGYIDVYGPAADFDGFIKPEYGIDQVHLNTKIIPHVKKQIVGGFHNWVVKDAH